VPSQQEEVQKQVNEKVKGRLFIKEFPTKTATVQTIRAYIQRLVATKNFIPDMVIVDYADLLRSSRGFEQKRFELEGVYEDLRALAQELNVVMITADQTNRSGLEMEVVTVAQIGEAYSKATVCDVIITISRRMEDKQSNTGRIFIAKSRLGRDGVVYPFTLNTATVKVSVLNQGEDPLAMFASENKNLAQKVGDRANKLGFGSGSGGKNGGSTN
jgi:replicative DNA helicase